MAAAGAEGGDAIGDRREEAAEQMDIDVPRPINTANRRFVYFDVQTTGFERDCHITWIAACSGPNQISTFVLPKVKMDPHAFERTGIICHGEHMYQHGKKVEPLKITRALEAFIGFLGNEPVVLVTHNTRRFECHKLMHALTACGLKEQFQQAVHGFVNTLPLFKELCPQLKNHGQQDLYRFYMKSDYPEHDAMKNALALQQIVEKAEPEHDAFERHFFTARHFIRYFEVKPEWDRLAGKKVITQSMAFKAAENELGWDEVRDTFQRAGEGGVKMLLRERLTRVNRIIDNIIKELQSDRSTTPGDGQ
ncbi:maternal protein exuperantia-1-like [Babylonia areolata]|uniref:maternal protein exuperantia-1-like n=1 Tax=Babylonia areolata TaxID=304850 RepID=UPI003FD3CF55